MEVREPSAKYLRTSYKQTELGLLPTDWRIAEIGQIAETSSGTTPPRSQYDRYFKGGVHAWVKTLDLNNAEILETDESVTDKAVEETSLRLFPEGSVLVAMYGGLRQIGRTGLLRLPAAVNQAITAIKPNPTVVCPEFLLFYLNHRVGHWQSVASSSRKDPNITGADVRAFKLPLPAIGEQQRLATALADADALIDSLEQLLTKKRQIKQGAMQELLTGKRRLPGFAGDWADRSLLQLADIRSGGTPSTRQAEFWDGTIPWCTPTDITALVGAKYIYDTERSISEKGQKASSAELLPAGTVVMTSRATIGECAIAAASLTTNQGFKNFVPRSTTCGEFLYYLLSTQKSAFLALCSGSTFLEIGKRQLADFVVRCPIELDEQSAIADALSSIDNEIAALESRLTKARALKQAMAQALLTGRIRLVEPTA